MKKIVKYSLILSLIFTFLTIVSFFLLDFGKGKLGFNNFNLSLIDNFEFLMDNNKNFPNNKGYKLIDEVQVENFNKLDIDFDNIEVVITPSKVYGYKLYTKSFSKKNFNKVSKNIKEIIDYTYNQDEKKLIINKEDINSDYKYKLEILSPDVNKLSCTLKADNCTYYSDTSLEKLNIDVDNSVIYVKGENSFPISIESDNSVININFDNYDAFIDAKFRGFGSIFGNAIIPTEKNKAIEKKIGDGKDLINIECDNATINIE